MGLYNLSWEFQGQNSHILFLGIPRIFLRIPKSLLKGSFEIAIRNLGVGESHIFMKVESVARNENFGSHPNLKICRQMSSC